MWLPHRRPFARPPAQARRIPDGDKIGVPTAAAAVAAAQWLLRRLPRECVDDDTRFTAVGGFAPLAAASGLVWAWLHLFGATQLWI